MSSSRLALFAAVSLSLAGCGILKKKQPEPAASVAVAPTAAPPPPPVAPIAEPAPAVPAVPTVDEASIPAPQDFEEEAFQKVTAANFKAELARLTKEITASASAKK